MDTSSGHRLDYFIKTQKIQQATVAADLGVAPAYVSMICTGKKSIGKKNAKRLQDLYGVSSAWLLTGLGEMLLSDSQSSKVSEPSTSHPAAVPAVSTEHLDGRPFYSSDIVHAYNSWRTSTDKNDGRISFPSHNDCDFWCCARGDSMHPTISSCDIVALKRVAIPLSPFINNEIYGLITTDGVGTIKRVIVDGDSLRLLSDNPSVPEQTINASTVLHVFRVLCCIKMF